jgi:hypothetical protein
VVADDGHRHDGAARRADALQEPERQDPPDVGRQHDPDAGRHVDRCGDQQRAPTPDDVAPRTRDQLAHRQADRRRRQGQLHQHGAGRQVPPYGRERRQVEIDRERAQHDQQAENGQMSARGLRAVGGVGPHGGPRGTVFSAPGDPVPSSTGPCGGP